MRLAVLVLVMALAACTPGDTRPSTGMLPQSFAPYGVEFSRYRAPELPSQMRVTGGTGYSVIAVTVAPDGRVMDAVGIEASDQAFIDAVLAVTPEWLFAPRRRSPHGTAPRAAALSVSLERRRQRVVAPRRRRGRVPRQRRHGRADPHDALERHESSAGAVAGRARRRAAAAHQGHGRDQFHRRRDGPRPCARRSSKPAIGMPRWLRSTPSRIGASRRRSTRANRCSSKCARGGVTDRASVSTG